MGRPARSQTVDLASLPTLAPLNLERESVSQQVIRSLTEYFFSGGVQPGKKLPSERQLSESLGVTRSAVRDAIQSLGLLGVLDIRQGDGTYLRRGGSALLPKVIEWALFLGEARVMDLVEARREIEVVMARLAAGRRSQEQLDEIAALIDQMGDPSISGSDFVELDVKFHFAIATSSGNTALREVLSSITSLLRAWMTRSIKAAGETRTSYAEHCLIFDALKSADSEAARKAMDIHMAKAQERLSRTLNQAPDDV